MINIFIKNNISYRFFRRKKKEEEEEEEEERKKKKAKVRRGGGGRRLHFLIKNCILGNIYIDLKTNKNTTTEKSKGVYLCNLN